MIQNASFARNKGRIICRVGKFYGEIIIYESKNINASFASDKGRGFIGESCKLG